MASLFGQANALPTSPSIPTEASGVDDPPIQSSLSYRRFTTHDGLPQMQTEIVWQDSRGYIYIGTLSGFVRYDGLTLTPFLGGQRENIVGFQEIDDDKSPEDREIRALGFVRQWSVRGKKVKKMQIDPLGHLLLNNFNASDLPAGYVLLEDRQEENRQLCRIEAEGMRSVMEDSLLDDMTPDRKMYVDKTGVYVPTPHGLYVIKDSWTHQLSEKDDVFSLIRTGNTVCVLAADGIYTIVGDSLKLLYEHHFEAPDYGLFVRQNKQGQLVIADSHTLWLYDGHSSTPMQQLGTGFNMIKGVFIDKWDRLWLATYQGAYCFFSYNFTNYHLTDKNDIVRAVANCNGHMVFGTLNGKVIVDDHLISSIDGNFYAPSAATIGDKVYLAGNGDIAYVQGDSLRWLGLHYDKFQFVAKARDYTSPLSEQLIIGTRNSILAYHPATATLDTLTTEIPRPWCAANDAQGRLWVGSTPGLFRLTILKEDEIEVKMMKSTPTAQVVTAMTADNRGNIYIALGDSVFTIREDEVKPVDEMLPMLAGHEIRALHVSPRGYFVVAAIDGLAMARIDEQGHAKDLCWFDSENGFTMIEPLMSTMAESEDGTVWLAGLEEMASFKPENLLETNQQSTIVETPGPWWRRWWIWLVAACLLSLVIWRITRWFEQRQAKKKMIDLLREKRQKELQLSAIRLKAIPHFHSNVLASIEYFMMNNSADEATHYLKLYSDFTNQTLTDINRPSRTITDEVDYVRSYLELEQLRFGERLQYDINVAADVDLGVMLPTMVLHTYCQNAVKHGIAAKSGTGHVEVSITRQPRQGTDGVLVAVKDDGVGRTEAAHNSGTSTKQGLKILQQQIELYNQTNRHKIEQNVIDLIDGEGHPAGTCFEIWVPADYKY